MEELYRAIEDRIRRSGVNMTVDGEAVYNELCDQIEDKDPGSYVFCSKQDEDILFEYKVDVLEEQFNLSSIDIHTDGNIYHVDFDD
jgi:hypothetical protein